MFAKKMSTIQNCYEKIKDRWWAMLLSIMFFSALSSIVYPIIVNKFTHEKPNVEIFYDKIQTTPFQYKSQGPLILKYNAGKNLYGRNYRVSNVGDKESKNFELEISTLNNIPLNPPEINCKPEIIKKRIIKEENSTNKLYRKFLTLPAGSKISISISSSYPFTTKDIIHEFCDDIQVWLPKETEIDLKKGNKISEAFQSIGNAIADESKKPVKEENKEKRSSGIFIGGYDPITLTDNIFKILQKKGIIDRKEAADIKNIIEESKEGVLFGGVNVLKFNEIVLNLLIKKNIISMEEANLILKKAKQSGGVLVGGYNIIVLEVEILNGLLKKGYISQKEGQDAIDSSQARVDSN